ncbi:hypothetical protein [Stigmatella erecta]|uniref:Uncharacterized protein n=1 Tax=Stigmatella erecta TaxID=83460 RepID=A0A1I0AE14_9BACT|nr:hypothetical protein [Stigmatella erecta]SES92331.1 hypothetical protein SAMN05443639_101649 [Stigmatella erecta]
MSKWVNILLVLAVAALPIPGEAYEPPKLTVLKSFRELAKAKKGDVLQLHVAPAGVVTGDSGVIYAEPCNPKDPAIQKRTGLVGTVEIEDVPAADSERMNSLNTQEFTNRSALTCYTVVAKLKATEAGFTKLSFLSAAPSGRRPYDKRLNPSRGD